MLTEGATQASAAASQASEDADARLYASLAVAWLLGARSLNPDSVDIPGRTTPADAPMPGTVLQAYDAARYAFQEVAARAADDQRARAAFLGVRTGVVEAEVKGRRVYRVETGALDSKEAERTRKLLQSNGIAVQSR